MNRRPVGLLLVLAFAAFGVALVVSSRGASGRRPPADSRPRAAAPTSGRAEREQAAVAAATRPGLRPATDDDATDSDSREELRKLYGDYRPFFVRGDLDGDGRLDFVQAFVRRDGPEPLFDVAVFFGSADGGFRPPVWVDRGLLLSGGDLSVDRSVLIVTEDVEQDVSRRWRWEAQGNRFVDVDGESGEKDGEPATEPDSRLGTTA